MALQQQITSLSGVKTDYHRVSEAMVNYTDRKAYITVLSYLEVGKREEEKAQSNKDEELKNKEAELTELVEAYDEQTDTPELKARRIELTNEVNALYERTPDDVAPRNIFKEQYELELPADTDFNLEFAYGWLKDNVFTDATDVQTVTLTTAQMPAHNHTLSNFDTTLGSSLMGSGSVPAWAMNTSKSKTTSSAGSGSAHNNLQPYIACYFWRRTAQAVRRQKNTV